MKRIVSLILAAMMLLSMTACGSKPADVRGEVETVAATEAQIQGEVETAPATEAPETEPAEEAEEAEEVDVQLGTTDSNTYTNKFLKLRCTLGADWEFYTDEEIRELNQLTQDSLSDQYAEMVKNADTLQDMYAINNETGETVNITISKMSLFAGAVLTTEDYADMAIPQLGPALESAGMTDVQVSKDTISFTGEDTTALRITCKVDGYDLFETMAVLKRGAYIICITSASYIEDTTMGALDAFAKI